MCVMPGIGIPQIRFRLRRRATRSSARRLRAFPARLPSQTCGNSVATISLRLRPVCSLAPKRPEIFDQRRFDEMMHVFRRRSVEPRRIARARSAISSSAVEMCLRFFLGKNSGGDERARPHAIHRQFVRKQAAIEATTTAQTRRTDASGPRSKRPPHIFCRAGAH